MMLAEENTMLHHISLRLLFLFIGVQSLWGAQTISGTIIDKTTGLPVEDVNITTVDAGTTSDSEGRFSLVVNSEDTAIRISHIGYDPLELRLPLVNRTIKLTPRKIGLPEITIFANRSIDGVTPVSFSTVTPEEISLRYSTEDAPMILSAEPGMYAYSESGNGAGYSYLSIRGFDQSRIAVMLDNVSLNDNESHQVYWVDHGDILSDASVVEIQRGIGNSLYGAASFGGSVNVVTRISNPDEKYLVSMSSGSYQTHKFRVQYFSDALADGKVHYTGRLTFLRSQGYRQDSQSEQHSFLGGIEYQSRGIIHQFRALLGKELSRLQWDGISREMVNDPVLRRGKMAWTSPFTDDFLQQIFSFNSFIPIRKNLVFRNTAYLVTGNGYYEIEKTGVDFYSYNLDINEAFTNAEELVMTTDLLRRKWITNHYFGITPVITAEWSNFRFDTGFELREYQGHHHGDVSQFSDQNLSGMIPGWYRYYDYDGKKYSTTFFAQSVWNVNDNMNVTGDIQFQHHDWTFSRIPIGHFSDVDISATWNFFSPRLGFTFKLDPLTTVFGTYGTAMKEPSDEQIITADDVRDVPKAAQPEKVYDLELGFTRIVPSHTLKVNYYRMTYKNEIISDIYDFENTDFDIVTADATLHHGVEFEASFRSSPAIILEFNGSLSTATYRSGNHQDHRLPNVPGELMNLTIQYTPSEDYGFSSITRFVGRQYIEANNRRELSIDPFSTMDLGFWFAKDNWTMRVRINNIFDILYETYGYEYGSGYYWPGATRNTSLNLEFAL